jgi:hypothetical protein
MNQLIYNFLNEIEDANKIKEISVEEFAKLVKSNKLISEEEGKRLIESFKKISIKKNADDESDDSEQRKKKYRQQHKEVDLKTDNIKQSTFVEKEHEDNSKER